MATLNSIITFTGKLGNIIAYSRGGKHFLRTRPETVRQTEGTRQAAKLFGAASRNGAFIRNAITPALDIHVDGTLVNRLNSAILKAGRNNHAGLTSFQFNGTTGIEKFFQSRPIFSKDGKLHIPAQQILPLGKTEMIEVTLIATRIDFPNRRVTGSDSSVLHIDPKQPFPGAEMPIVVPGKGTLVVTLQIRSYLPDGLSYSRKCQAADIIAVVEEEKDAISVKTHPCRKLYLQQPELPQELVAPQSRVQRE
ncbi:hypothetical protein [Chitinophaga rhizosphaerae]|uniref:hypothetical protein n=1 Tax=Chitinophaga rhizosphaerae TaxID=1864947 RepID=UPI000F8152EB|nr:hypothetical protein [Chitinophaga rhizosphaerae]